MNGTLGISNFLNRLLHEVLRCAPATMQMDFLFNKVNMFPLLEEFSLKIILFLPRVKNSEQQESDIK
jgi:hypothetical protein